MTMTLADAEVYIENAQEHLWQVGEAENDIDRADHLQKAIEEVLACLALLAKEIGGNARSIRAIGSYPGNY